MREERKKKKQMRATEQRRHEYTARSRMPQQRNPRGKLAGPRSCQATAPGQGSATQCVHVKGRVNTPRRRNTAGLMKRLEQTRLPPAATAQGHSGGYYGNKHVATSTHARALTHCAKKAIRDALLLLPSSKPKRHGQRRGPNGDGTLGNSVTAA